MDSYPSLQDLRLYCFVARRASFVAAARSQPWWAEQEAVAPTLPYDATVMGDYSLPEDRAKLVSVGRYALRGVARPEELFTLDLTAH